MASYTLVGQELWLWAPFVALTDLGRMTWLALMTTPHAKRTPPGLWNGSALVLAEQSHKPIRDTLEGLTELADHRLIDRDDDRRVIALTRLPDRCEKPSNSNVLKKWWNLFRGIPVCPVRDRWIDLLAWLCFAPNETHEKLLTTWEATFGTLVQVPSGPSIDQVRPLDKQCALPFSDLGLGSGNTDVDTVSYTPRIRMRIRDQDQGSESEIRDQSRWAPPPPVVEPSVDTQPKLLSVIQGGLVAETQEHDSHGNPWGPDGPPRDRFINGRRRNL